MVAFYLPNALLLISGVAFMLSSCTLPNALAEIEKWKQGELFKTAILSMSLFTPKIQFIPSKVPQEPDPVLDQINKYHPNCKTHPSRTQL